MELNVLAQIITGMATLIAAIVFFISIKKTKPTISNPA